MTGPSVATAPRPNPAFAGWLALVLPPGLGRDDRALFRDFAVLGGALFAITSIAYAWTIDWRGAIPRDGTTLAVGRDFLNFWMYGRAAVSADPGRSTISRPITRRSAISSAWSFPARTGRIRRA